MVQAQKNCAYAARHAQGARQFWGKWGRCGAATNTSARGLRTDTDANGHTRLYVVGEVGGGDSTCSR
jgi:hypothetical protein